MHITVCIMKNVTLRVDERVLSKARKIAGERSTSVNAMIREYLDEMIRVETRQDQARRELLELCAHSEAEVGERNWTRDDLYAR